MHTSTSNSGILTFVSALTALFASFNYFDGAALPWFWVLSPLWITALSVPALFVIVAVRNAYLATLTTRENCAKACPRALETV